MQQACSDPETITWLGGDVINERYDLDRAGGFIPVRSPASKRERHELGDADTATDVLLGHMSLTGVTATYRHRSTGHGRTQRAVARG